MVGVELGSDAGAISSCSSSTNPPNDIASCFSAVGSASSCGSNAGDVAIKPTPAPAPPIVGAAKGDGAGGDAGISTDFGRVGDAGEAAARACLAS